jgi:hypothetical protein
VLGRWKQQGNEDIVSKIIVLRIRNSKIPRVKPGEVRRKIKQLKKDNENKQPTSFSKFNL